MNEVTATTRDTVSGSRPRTVSVLNSLSDITVRWMAGALGPAHAGPELTEVSVVQIGQDSGHLGTSARVQLTYTAGRARGPATVVVKMPAQSVESLETARRGRLYEREVGFFTELAPHTEVRAPGCYAAGYAEEAGTFVLVLEDVEARAECDQLLGCPPDRAQQIVRQLARLHASWWEHPALREHTWLTSFLDEARVRNMSRLLEQGWPLACARLGDRLSPQAGQIGAAVLEHFGQVMRMLDEPAQTLLHGDTRLDNVMFDAGVGRAPVVLLDWQNVSRGPAVAELGYFLAQNLTAQDFAEHLDALLGVYCDELRSHGVDGESPDTLRTALWQALPITFTVAAAMFVMADLTRPRALELAAVMTERAVAAAQELGLAEALATLPRTTGEIR